MAEWLRRSKSICWERCLEGAILPHFRQAGRGKIVQLSGGGATGPLPYLSAYAASKTAVIRFVETLAEETRQAIASTWNALALGALDTRMLDEFIAAGPEKIGPEFHQCSVRRKREGGVPLHRGADLAVFLGSASSDGITGKRSAPWDNWRALSAHLDELSHTDIYNLRRIVPGDRGLDWGETD